VEMARLVVLAAQEAAQRYGFLDDESREVLFTALQKATSADKARIFEEIIGPAIDADSRLLWSFEDLTEKKLLDEFEPDQVIRWAEQKPDTRLYLIARSVPVSGQPLGGLARTLLVRHGAREDVRSALAATFGTGQWTGAESYWLADKFEQLQRWAQDPDPNVRRWATEQLEFYERRLDRVRLLEEEEHY
jgi:hypothetical protein